MTILDMHGFAEDLDMSNEDVKELDLSAAFDLAHDVSMELRDLDGKWRGNHRPADRAMYEESPEHYGAGRGDAVDSVMPDYYEHPEYYGTGERYDKESTAILRRLRGKPDAPVTIYRAVPKEYAGEPIRPGDWVTVSPSYARQHNESQFNGEGSVLSLVAKARDIYTSGDSHNEFGYDPAPQTADLSHDVSHELRGPHGEWVKSVQSLGLGQALDRIKEEQAAPEGGVDTNQPIGVLAKMYSEHFGLPAKHQMDLASLKRAGWSDPITSGSQTVRQSSTGDLIALPKELPAEVEAHVTKLTVQALNVARKSMPVEAQKTPITVSILGDKAWTQKLHDIGAPPEINGQPTDIGGFVDPNEDEHKIYINPKGMFFDAPAYGRALPVHDSTSSLKYTLTHESGHVVANIMGDAQSYNQYHMGDQFKGQLSEYADVNPAEAYAEAWTEWVLGNKTGNTSTPEFAVAKQYADQFKWQKGVTP